MKKCQLEEPREQRGKVILTSLIFSPRVALAVRSASREAKSSNGKGKA